MKILQDNCYFLIPWLYTVAPGLRQVTVFGFKINCNVWNGTCSVINATNTARFFYISDITTLLHLSGDYGDFYDVLFLSPLSVVPAIKLMALFPLPLCYCFAPPVQKTFAIFSTEFLANWESRSQIVSLETVRVENRRAKMFLRKKKNINATPRRYLWRYSIPL